MTLGIISSSHRHYLTALAICCPDANFVFAAYMSDMRSLVLFLPAPLYFDAYFRGHSMLQLMLHTQCCSVSQIDETMRALIVKYIHI
ncbi:hypothetical protein BO83DRAFT_2383 [Aspergillus eucalypticola CBS 122712]|uniref:Uncharacterized protein n=1 Tax=Aspergillus eucalypticola (strain CBS 122712 / IBT 29274) TaxID=1448314 RepID=A0A317WFN7_ASPEC|nr:uncharacterized protein BO83DRAFT_2383 [Aspergillus eucalypticola CBS 122712]PWY85223.1 hypothetical protein BO83DRAFT_2383 [Aspergillus eucalypticola CBS 122712]